MGRARTSTSRLDSIVGTVFATTKAVLRTAERSPMFESAWKALGDEHEIGSWVCVSDPLDPAWVASVGDG
jgi:hypothetical protein